MEKGEKLSLLHYCMEKCEHCYDSCLKEEDVKMMVECIRLDRECSEICSYLERAIARNSPYVSQLAVVAAQICRDCAEECSKHEHDHCQECAKACAEAVELCEELAKN